MFFLESETTAKPPPAVPGVSRKETIDYILVKPEHRLIMVPIVKRRHKSFESNRKYIRTVKFKDEISTQTQPPLDEIVQLGQSRMEKYDEILFGGVQMHFYCVLKQFS